MRHAVFASAVLTFTLAQPALAQLEDKPVPMDKALEFIEFEMK